MSTPVQEILTSNQFVKVLNKWLKDNKVGPRKLARLAKTSVTTLYKIRKKPDSITGATIDKYRKVMMTYRGDEPRPSKPAAR